MAESLDDFDMLAKLENQTIAYHQSCYAAYQLKEKRSTEEHKEHSDSDWHKHRNLHKLAFESLCDLVTQEIIHNNKVMYLAHLFLRYQALVLEFADMFKISTYHYFLFVK